MRRALLIILVVSLLVLGGSGYLFWVQNSQQEVLTSFELWGLGRWGRTWRVPELIAISGGSGVLVGFVVGWWVTATLKNRRIRALSGGGDAP